MLVFNLTCVEEKGSRLDGDLGLQKKRRPLIHAMDDVWRDCVAKLNWMLVVQIIW